jgi:hypothetical protein
MGGDLLEMFATRVESTAILEFTPPGLQKFHRALELWRDGGEDFSVHPNREGAKDRAQPTKDLNSAEVWFWRAMQP